MIEKCDCEEKECRLGEFGFKRCKHYEGEVSQAAPPAPRGLRHNSGKPKYHLIPPEALLAAAKVLTFGATKYADRNWENGLPYSDLIRGLLSHITSFSLGERVDAESGLPTSYHILANAIFLVTHDSRPNLTAFDDLPARPTPGRRVRRPRNS